MGAAAERTSFGSLTLGWAIPACHRDDCPGLGDGGAGCPAGCGTGCSRFTFSSGLSVALRGIS